MFALHVHAHTHTQVIPITSHMVGTMAGGAADCTAMLRQLKEAVQVLSAAHGQRLSVAATAHFLANNLLSMRPAQLSIGTMIAGYDDR